MDPPAAPTGRRFVFLDALRGFASLAVVLFHAKEGHHVDRLCEALPAFAAFLAHGYLGVAAFFVLSGFVIAHSMARDDVTPGYVGRFLLRRSIRLDPPYWASMLVVVAFGLLSVHFVAGKVYAVPSASRIAVHMLYLQDLLGVEPLNSIYWTLCLEIQFYLTFSLLMLIATRLRRSLSRERAFYAVVVPAAVIAALWPWRLAPFDVRGLFLPMWHLFVAGVLVWWAVVVRPADRRAGALALGCLVVLGVAGVCFGNPVTIAGVSTAALIYAVARLQRLGTWLAARPFQMLGAISYSLYLVHNSIMGAAFRVAYRLTGDSLASEAFWMLAVIAISIGCAWLFHRAVERPALALSRRIRLRS